MQTLLRANRNTRLFVKNKKPKNDTPTVRAEKNKLIQQFIEQHGVSRCAPAFSMWTEGDTSIWKS